MNNLYILLVLITAIIIVSMLIVLKKIDGTSQKSEKKHVSILLTQVNGETVNIGNINSIIFTPNNTKIKYTELGFYEGVHATCDRTLKIPNKKISRLEIRGE